LKFEGVFSVLPTPFNGDGEIDLESLRRVVDLFLKAGVNGVTVLGVTGEVSRLRDKERDVVLHTVLDHIKGRVPVIAGTTAEGLRTCLEYSRAAKAAGAAAVMVSPPRMNRLNSDAVVAHYKALAEAVDIDIVFRIILPCRVSPWSLDCWCESRERFGRPARLSWRIRQLRRRHLASWS